MRHKFLVSCLLVATSAACLVMGVSVLSHDGEI